MKVLRYPERNQELIEAIARPTADLSVLRSKVAEIFEAIRKDGDAALIRLTEELDKISIKKVLISKDEIAAQAKLCPVPLQKAIATAKGNLEKFHRVQKEVFSPLETMPGVLLWRRSTPIEKIGLYVPGGSAPLFSTVLMLGVPAQIAGCGETILCTPPQKDGAVHPAIAFAAQTCGLSKIACIGGAQAIAAMVFGTESVPKVFKVFGPGNQYVTMAKQLAQEYGVGIDLPAGPSELAVIADGTANPACIAADLLSQAEHGTDSHTLLVTTSETLADKVHVEISKQIAQLPRKEIAKEVLAKSVIVIVKTIEEAVNVVNIYAPEHLSVDAKDVDVVCERVSNAGSVFVGSFSPVSAGDYASGTNHTLPTNGWAAITGGVSLESFLKRVTFQKITREGLQALGNTIMTMAEAEGLKGHAQAVRIRM
jgi:histidinol dehydrogenase